VYFVLNDGRTLVPGVVVADEEPLPQPDELRVRGNYPNPFRGATTLTFDLPEASDVRVEVFDLLGRRVLAAVPGPLPAGAAHACRLDAAALPSGTYFYRLTALAPSGTRTATGQMVVVR
jgi:hypothetical protein